LAISFEFSSCGPYHHDSGIVPVDLTGENLVEAIAGFRNRPPQEEPVDKSAYLWIAVQAIARHARVRSRIFTDAFDSLLIYHPIGVGRQTAASRREPESRFASG
jgi:hypothetical protein